ncbi:hypothetical protein RAS1_00700 [Phycisphaerae bacterium RAS1]|nr:hypothetical protein RAS1_00700 [Phycisphaerae bacterium RAS1]
MKTCLSAIRAIACVGFASVALASDFTFTATSGDWGTPSNWDPASVPSTGDAATIPNGKTCSVGNANQTCGKVTVDSGGTLKVTARDLTISSSGPSGARLVVNGDLKLEKPSSTVGRIVFSGFEVEVSGSGTISALADNGGGGTIVGDGTYLFKVGSTVTMVGSIVFLTGVENNGYMHVNDSNDQMDFGDMTVSSRFTLRGTGGIAVSAGTVRFGRVEFKDSFPGVSLEVTGGEMRLTTYGYYVDTFASFHINGGTLTLQKSLTNKGGLEFRGGQIDVSADVIAVFEYSES